MRRRHQTSSKSYWPTMVLHIMFPAYLKHIDLQQSLTNIESCIQGTLHDVNSVREPLPVGELKDFISDMQHNLKEMHLKLRHVDANSGTIMPMKRVKVQASEHPKRKPKSTASDASGSSVIQSPKKRVPGFVDPETNTYSDNITRKSVPLWWEIYYNWSRNTKMRSMCMEYTFAFSVRRCLIQEYVGNMCTVFIWSFISTDVAIRTRKILLKPVLMAQMNLAMLSPIWQGNIIMTPLSCAQSARRWCPAKRLCISICSYVGKVLVRRKVSCAMPRSVIRNMSLKEDWLHMKLHTKHQILRMMKVPPPPPSVKIKRRPRNNYHELLICKILKYFIIHLLL